MLHLYCIVPAERRPAGLDGVGGAPVRAVAAGRLACWTSDAAAPGTVDVDDLRAHNAVIAAAMDERSTPVPFRFGQRLADDAAVRAELERRAAHWSALLDRFAGHVEFGVRLEAGAARTDDGAGQWAREMQTSTAKPGTAYMEALARRQAEAAQRSQEGERVAAQIRTGAADVIRDSRSEPLTTPGGLITMAHLVAWSGVTTYHASVDAARGAHPDLRFHCTGPWPPYSFVPDD
jgi:hypothetical protein